MTEKTYFVALQSKGKRGGPVIRHYVAKGFTEEAATGIAMRAFERDGFKDIVLASREEIRYVKCVRH
jgi:hypothetical protein